MAGTRRSLTGPLPASGGRRGRIPPPGSRSPLRVGGIALLGVGVIAAFAGLITTTQGNGNGTVAQAPTASAGVLESAAPAAPDRTGRGEPAPGRRQGGAGTGHPLRRRPDGRRDGGRRAAPPASAVPAPAPAPVEPAPPAVAAPAPAAGAGRPSSVRAWPLRVYNNSLIQGLAARAAKPTSAAAGWTVAEIGGYPGATIPHEHRLLPPGTAEQTAAQEIGRAFGLRVEPRFAGIAVRQPRGDRHRHQGVPIAGQVVSALRRRTAAVSIRSGPAALA